MATTARLFLPSRLPLPLLTIPCRCFPSKAPNFLSSPNPKVRSSLLRFLRPSIDPVRLQDAFQPTQNHNLRFSPLHHRRTSPPYPHRILRLRQRQYVPDPNLHPRANPPLLRRLHFPTPRAREPRRVPQSPPLLRVLPPTREEKERAREAS